MDRYVTRNGYVNCVVEDVGVREIQHDDDDYVGIDGCEVCCDALFPEWRDRGSREENLRMIARKCPRLRGTEILLDGKVAVVE